MSKVTRPKRQARGELMPWSYPLLAFGLIGALLLVFLCQYAQLVRTQYALVESKARLQALQREESELGLQIQELTSLERIETIALARLKMAPPARRQVLDVAAWEKARKARDLAVVPSAPVVP